MHKRGKRNGNEHKKLMKNVQLARLPNALQRRLRRNNITRLCRNQLFDLSHHRENTRSCGIGSRERRAIIESNTALDDLD
jgi:hypothetical protein